MGLFKSPEERRIERDMKIRQGIRRIEKGDCLNQRPGIPHREIACSKDLEVLEIVAPSDFKTRIVDAPTSAAAAE